MDKAFSLCNCDFHMFSTNLLVFTKCCAEEKKRILGELFHSPLLRLQCNRYKKAVCSAVQCSAVQLKSIKLPPCSHVGTSIGPGKELMHHQHPVATKKNTLRSLVAIFFSCNCDYLQLQLFVVATFCSFKFL